jgi:hypothetical protein
LADFLVRQIPIPQPRPSSLSYTPEEPFFEEGLKIGIERMKEQFNYVLEFISQLNTGYLPENYNYGSHDIWPFLGVIAVVVGLGYLIVQVFKR